MKSPAAVSILSLALLLPLGAGMPPDRSIALVMTAAAATLTKHIVFTNGSTSAPVETQAANVDAFLRERGIVARPEDTTSVPLDTPLADGDTVVYRPAVSITVIRDGTARTLLTSATTVRAALETAHVAVGNHDTVAPDLAAPVAPDAVIKVQRVTSWLERIRTAIKPPVHKTAAVGLDVGAVRVLDPGRAGAVETTVEVLQPDPAIAPKRLAIASRILRFPRAKVIARGVGDYSALAGIARRGMAGTLRLADQALAMVATAYTSECFGCSGMTASGKRAGHGVVAVDPRLIPLGTRLFIPGYGQAYAGDTGGNIRGHRIDLGFDSSHDARSFGRRPIVVYILK